MEANLTTLLSQIISNRSITENMIEIPGRLAYGLASTDLGKKALAVGAGMYALRQWNKKRQAREDRAQEDTENPSQPTPVRAPASTPQWLKQGRVNYA